jgi:hypothetical protein
MSTVAFTKPAFNSIYIPVIPANMMYCGKPFGTEEDIAYLFEHVMQIGIVRRTDIITRQKGHIHVRSAFVHFTEWLPKASEWLGGLVTPDSKVRIHGYAWNGFWGGVSDKIHIKRNTNECNTYITGYCTSRYLTIKINKNPIIDVDPMQLEQLNVHQLVDNIRRLEEQLTARDARIAELEEREVRRENDRDDVLAGMAIEITELRKLNKKMEAEMEWQNQLLDHRADVIEKLEKEIAYANDGGYPDDPLTLADLQTESPETAEEEYVYRCNDRRMKKFYGYDSEEEDVMCPPLSMEDLEVQEITESAQHDDYEDGECDEDEESIDGRTRKIMNENEHIDEMMQQLYGNYTKTACVAAEEAEASAGDDEFTFDFQPPKSNQTMSVSNIKNIPSASDWPTFPVKSRGLGLHFVTELPFNIAVLHIHECLSSIARNVSDEPVGGENSADVMFQEVRPATQPDTRTWGILSLVDQTYMEVNIYQNCGYAEYIVEANITPSETLFDIFDMIRIAMYDKAPIGIITSNGSRATYGS